MSTLMIQHSFRYGVSMECANFFNHNFLFVSPSVSRSKCMLYVVDDCHMITRFLSIKVKQNHLEWKRRRAKKNELELNGKVRRQWMLNILSYATLLFVGWAFKINDYFILFCINRITLPIQSIDVRLRDKIDRFLFFW